MTHTHIRCLWTLTFHFPPPLAVAAFIVTVMPIAPARGAPVQPLTPDAPVASR